MFYDIHHLVILHLQSGQVNFNKRFVTAGRLLGIFWKTVSKFTK
jgi:hypothetical protein